MPRPACAVHVSDVPGEKRPRRLPAEGISSEVRAVSDAAGLSRMGVGLRTVPPGFASTHRHFHSVEEEWVYVLSGSGQVRIGPHRTDVRPGSFVGFPPGPCPHHCLAGGDEPLVILEGGERRRDEDTCAYPDLGKAAFRRQLSDAEAPAEEEGALTQCVRIDDLAVSHFQHEVDERARRDYRSLHTPTGLVRQAVRWSQVASGDRTTAYHTHDRTDEWIYLLDGRARVRVGDDHFQVSAGDFVAHPAGGPPHVMEAETLLTYLMGGMRDPDDIVTYPEAGVQRRGGRIVPTAEGTGR
jgi:uncharacterized cupin superfamily protein